MVETDHPRIMNSSEQEQNCLTFIDNGSYISIPTKNLTPVIFSALDVNGNKHIILRDKDSTHRLIKSEQTVKINSEEINVYENLRIESLPCSLNFAVIYFYQNIH